MGTKLRQRMIEDLQLRGMSERTQEMYVRAVRKLAEHYNKSPDKLTEEDLRQYFLYLKNVKKFSRAASSIMKITLLMNISYGRKNTLNCVTRPLCPYYEIFIRSDGNTYKIQNKKCQRTNK